MMYKDTTKEYEIEFSDIKNVSGKITPSFSFRMSSPFQATGSFSLSDIKTEKGHTGIQFSKYSGFAKTVCKGKQSVLVSISSEAIDYIKEVTKSEIEKLRAAAQEDPESWTWYTGCDTGNLMVSPAGGWEFRPDLLEIKDTIEHVHKFDAYELFGVMEGRGEVSHEEIMKLYNAIISVEEEETEDNESEIFEAAEETGEPQLIESYAVDVEGDEENSTDIVKVYAMPDGTKKRKVIHTY